MYTIWLISPSILQAEQISVTTQKPVSFGVKIGEINKITNTEATRFNFEPINIKNNSTIDHWKIRVYCKDKIFINVNELTENSCGKAVQIANTDTNAFSISLINPTGRTTAFSFKLKAYDKNGDWLHSEKQSFQWNQ